MGAAPRVSLGRKLAVFSCATLLSLAAAEGLARLAHPAAIYDMRVPRFVESERAKFCRYSPLLGWEGIPNAQGTCDWSDARWRVEQNAYGFRGAQYSRERGPKRRVVVLGDSFVWGFGVDDDEIFTSLLEKDPSYGGEVVNLGIVGYGTDQELLLWRGLGKTFHPDVVLLVVTPMTDVYDNIFPERYHYLKPVIRFEPDGRETYYNLPVPKRAPDEAPKEPNQFWTGSLLQRLALHSDLTCLVLSAAARNPEVRAALERWKVIAPRKVGWGWEHHFFETPFDAKHEQAWKLLGSLVGALAKEVTGAGAKLVLVAVPSELQVYPDLWKRFAAHAEIDPGSTLDRLAPNRRLASIAKEKGLAFLDLLPAFEAAAPGQPLLYFPQNAHWTPPGHRIVASVLAKSLGATPRLGSY